MRLRPLMSIFKVQLIKRNQKRKVLSWIQWHFHRLQPLLQVSGLWHIMWMWIHYLHVLISFLTLKTLALEAHALSRLFCGLSWATEWQLKIAIDLANCSNISKRAFYIKTHLSGSWLENLHRSQKSSKSLAGESAAGWRMTVFVSWGNLSYSYSWFLTVHLFESLFKVEFQVIRSFVIQYANLTSLSRITITFASSKCASLN